MKIIVFKMGFDIEKSFIMAERLKQLREEKGLSHEKLGKALFDQYGVKISPDSLINYEVSDANHTKAYKNQGMRVEYLRCLADYYGVSTDYILGNINDPCRMPSAIDDLGLSEKSVQMIKSIGSLDDASEILSGLNMILEGVNTIFISQKIKHLADAVQTEMIYAEQYVAEHQDVSANCAFSPSDLLNLDDNELGNSLENQLVKDRPELAGRIAVVCGKAVLDIAIRDIVDCFTTEVQLATGYFEYLTQQMDHRQ